MTGEYDRKIMPFWKFLGFVLIASAFAGHAIVSGKYELLVPAAFLGLISYFGIVVSTIPSPRTTKRHDQ